MSREFTPSNITQAMRNYWGRVTPEEYASDMRRFNSQAGDLTLARLRDLPIDVHYVDLAVFHFEDIARLEGAEPPTREDVLDALKVINRGETGIQRNPHGLFPSGEVYDIVRSIADKRIRA